MGQGKPGLGCTEGVTNIVKYKFCLVIARMFLQQH